MCVILCVIVCHCVSLCHCACLCVINALTKTSKKTYTNIHRQEYTQAKNAHKTQLTKKKTQNHIYTNKYIYAFHVIISVVYNVRYNLTNYKY